LVLLIVSPFLLSDKDMGKWEELISGSLYKHTRLVHTVANRVDHGAGDAGKPNDWEDLRQRKCNKWWILWYGTYVTARSRDRLRNTERCC
jgi:hypothetical protein